LIKDNDNQQDMERLITHRRFSLQQCIYFVEWDFCGRGVVEEMVLVVQGRDRRVPFWTR
jgi:hypothetical protein